MPIRRPLLRTPSSAYRGTCAIGIITNERYKATTIPSPIDSHLIVSFLNVPMCFASRPKADICMQRKMACPLYPQKQTYAAQNGMSALGQKRTSDLFDHFVRAARQ